MKKSKSEMKEISQYTYVIKNAYIKATMHILLHNTMVSHGKGIGVKEKKKSRQEKGLIRTNDDNVCAPEDQLKKLSVINTYCKKVHKNILINSLELILTTVGICNPNLQPFFKRKILSAFHIVF